MPFKFNPKNSNIWKSKWRKPKQEDKPFICMTNNLLNLTVENKLRKLPSLAPSVSGRGMSWRQWCASARRWACCSPCRPPFSWWSPQSKSFWRCRVEFPGRDTPACRSLGHWQVRTSRPRDMLPIETSFPNLYNRALIKLNCNQMPLPADYQSVISP